MPFKIHDSFGHVRETIASAETAHGHAHENPLMRHLFERSKTSDEHTALTAALTGEDADAVLIATRQNESTGEMGRLDAGVLAMLADTCGGIDPQVAVALIPWLGDESSIEDEDDHSGLAWRDGGLIVDATGTGGIHCITDGSVRIFMDFPQTICAAAGGRTMGDLLELPAVIGGRVIESMESGDGETLVRLAA